MGTTNKLEEIKKYFEEEHIEDLLSKIGFTIGYLEDDNNVSKQDFINILRAITYKRR